MDPGLHGEESALVARPEHSGSGFSLLPIDAEHLSQLVEQLTPEQHQVTQKSGTEAAFCGGFLTDKAAGTYGCVVCHLPLFRSNQKFDSGTGWPSFFDTFDPDHVCQKPDGSHGMERIEITCGRCDAHLGHLFLDGPPPTGVRHCLNSASLRFVSEGQEIPSEAPLPGENSIPKARAWFGGG
jgi:peptide-methionine (R)-S-oxide reductase